MKGYASEVLLVCGALIFPHSVTFSIILVILGCVGALTRYAVAFNQLARKEKLYEAITEFIKKIVETGSDPFDTSVFVKKENIH
tara:strand:- start:616 stop:867 length:252 start_codon:yes stop_codon:yes gene_type:complete